MKRIISILFAAQLLIIGATLDVWSGSTITPKSGANASKESWSSVGATTTFTSSNNNSIASGGYLTAVFATTSAAQDNVTSITQTGNTWARLGTHSCNNGGTDIDIWGAQNNASGTTTHATLNFTGTIRINGLIYQWRGVKSASEFDVGASCNTGSSTTPATNAVTPTYWDLCIAAFSAFSSEAGFGATNNGYTAIQNGSAAFNSKGSAYIVDVLQNAGATSTSLTWGAMATSTTWAATLVCVKPAALNALGLQPF